MDNSIAGNIQNITEAVILPPGTRERFLGFSGKASEILWNMGIDLGGISELEKGYYICRPKCRWHIMLYCTGGEGEVNTPEGMKVLREGDFAWLPAGTDHKYQCGGKFSICWLHISPEHHAWKFLHKTSMRVSPAKSKEFPRLFEFLNSEFNNRSELDEHVCRAGIKLISACIDRELSSDTTQSTLRQRQTLDELWSKVGADLSLQWSVDLLAKTAFISAPHLHTLSAKLYGISPMGMVKKMRMEQAGILLRHTDCKLDEIAQMIGYSCAFSLSRTFKRHTGLSPKEWRKNSKAITP